MEAEMFKHKIPHAFEKLRQQYEADQKEYYCEAREYYSTASIIFDVDGDPVTVAGQPPRYTLNAVVNQQAQLFAYKVGDQMQIANVRTQNGAGTRVATKADTNLLEASKTNNEDFAASAIGLQARGIRLEFSQGANYPAALSAAFTAVIQGGTQFLQDPGAHIMPPEVDSPLILEDRMLRAIGKSVNFRERWDNRAEDDIALGRGLGPLGAESFLKAMGEPSTSNAKRLDPGILWRRPNQDTDTKFNIEATLHDPIWMEVTWPQELVAAGQAFGTLLRIHMDYQVVLVGHAFYYPSGNA